MKILNLITYILLFCYSFAWGQEENNKELFKQISINEGLSHSDATSIIQDNYSFLWVGTNSGLNKYDGYSIETYKWDPNDTKSIQGNRILKLVSTKDKIWLLIENKGLYYYDLLHLDFHLVKSIPKITPHSFLFQVDEEESLWLFHKTIGLVTFLSNQSTFKSDAFKKIALEENPLHLPKLKRIIEVDGVKYFFDQKGYVYKYAAATKKLVSQTSFNKGSFLTAYKLENSNILISCENGAFIWNCFSNNISKNPEISTDIKITSIYQNDKTYYLGTMSGLYKGAFNLNNQFVIEEIIPQVIINDIFKDKYDILWIATSGSGLFYKNLLELPFGHIRQSTSKVSFKNNYTSAIFKERNNKDELWIGSRAGLNIYHIPSKKHTKTIKELTNKHIKYIYQDSKEDIWIGTRENGLYRYRGKNLIKHYKKSINNNNSISSNHIVSISEDQLGRIWFASFDNGISVYDREADYFEHIFHEPYNKQSLGSNNLTFLYFHRQHECMYISSRDAGITVVNFVDKGEMRYSHIVADEGPNGLSINYTWSINSKNNDTLYVGTIGGGLNILIAEKNKLGAYSYTIENITKTTGLADNDIESVELDNSNRIWMGGLGLSMYEPKTKKTVNYDVEDGLQSNSFKVGSSYYDEEQDVMYFGGVNGINFFTPKEIKTVASPIDVQISGLEILNSRVNIGEEINDRVLLNSRITDSTSIRLQAKENQFSILYKSLNFVSPKKNKVEYKLEPFQKDWIKSSYPNQSATFSNLPRGDYTFRIRAVNKEGGPAPKESTLNIYIEPYWYLSNFAFFIYLLCIGGLFYAYHVSITNRQTNKEKLAESEKKQLLNQEKLDFFTKISHEIRTPLTLIVGPLEDLLQERKQIGSKKEVLQSISRHTNRLLNMVNKLLDFRKMDLGHNVLMASPTGINEFTSEVFMFFKEKAYSKRIDYQLISLPKELIIYIDKEKLETVLINLLSNAFKFTPNNGHVSLKLEVVGSDNKASVFNNQKEPIQNYLNISIEDSGIGIPIEKKDKIFNQYYQLEKNNAFNTMSSGIGLALVKSIIKLHHFKIDVNSNKKKEGSVFSLRIPLGKAYLGNDELLKDDLYTPSSLKENDEFDPTEPIIGFEQNTLDLFDKDTLTKKKKLLIVEDNTEIQLYISEHLRKYFQILNAENGKEGYKIAQKEVPDIIISDVMMPVMNGMEFSKLIKTNEELHHIPIILLTAITSTANELEGLKLGIEDYIRKPFKIDLLLAKIFSILENRKYIAAHYSKLLHYTPASLDNLTDDDIFLQKLIKLIEDNIQNEQLNVAFIGNAMAMGRTKLYTKIKELTGRSIIEFIRDIRMKKAGSILLTSKENIGQIAFNVGLNDVKYFRKHFKVMYKMNPSEYRKGGA